MQDAARFTLLPTVGATNDAAALGQTWTRAQRLDQELQAEGSFPDGWVRVETLSPTLTDFHKATEGPAPVELEFDGPIVNGNGLELRVRVRMLYELRIPFASTAIFVAYLADRAARALSFPVAGVTPAFPDLGSEARGIESSEGAELVSHDELQALWAISKTGLGDGSPRLFLPMSATYRVRMQSNFYRRFLPVEDSP
jgi:hypothetical protein